MPLKDIHAFMDYYRTNYHADIESIERSISGLSGSDERKFQLNAEKIKLYSTFLDEKNTTWWKNTTQTNK